MRMAASKPRRASTTTLRTVTEFTSVRANDKDVKEFAGLTLR